MRKFIVTLLTFICLSFNIYKITPLAAPGANTLKEGIYTMSKLNLSPDKVYSVQNISKDKSISIILYDNDQNATLFLKLAPKSEKQNLLPMKEGNRIVVVGDGELYIS